jgi:N-acetylglucosaminyldiphosphoundecaprenol N-acetyl-beta-D-mannosaminyltransferase
VNGLSMAELVQTIMTWTETEGMKVAVGVNANVCNLAASDATFREILLSADLDYPDGQSIVWAARALGADVPERVATTDLINPLVAECARQGKKLYLFGAAPGVAARAGQRLAERAPGLRYMARDGYVSEEDMPGLIAEIAAYDPDILLVGLGDPLQQAWLADHRSELHVPAVLTCGGLFDWVSGANRRAPQWMISAGLEWLWRLILEPRRLAKRYLAGNPVFMGRFTMQFLRSRFTGVRA